MRRSAAWIARSATWRRSCSMACFCSYCTCRFPCSTRSCASLRAWARISPRMLSASRFPCSMMRAVSRRAWARISWFLRSVSSASARAFWACSIDSLIVLSRSSSVVKRGFQANFASRAARQRKVMTVQMTVPGSGGISWEPMTIASLLERQEDADDQGEERGALDEGHWQREHGSYPGALEDVHQAEQGQDCDVSGGHVGEQADAEREGLGAHPDDLDRDHDR